MTARYRAGVDIGGTFTDLVIVDTTSGEVRFGKTLTTHADPSEGIERVLVAALAEYRIDMADVVDIIHGTTLVTNALIERKGATTALFATEGFRDVLEIRKEHRFELYDLRITNPVPLVPRSRAVGIPQRTYADGTRGAPLDEAAVLRETARLYADGVTAIAVAYLHSYADATDERRTRDLIAEVAPDIRVSLSSDVVPEIREFERTTTTVANVYVQQIVDQYLSSLVARLARLGFDGELYVMLSSGGTATVATATAFPIRMLESGPAGGALAAASYGVTHGHDSLLSFDMGGTTAKLCVVSHGEPLITQEFEVDRAYRFKKGSGMPVRTPVIEMIEIGAGGGSIARIDSLGLLTVGPESAGSEPGPVCYGRGGAGPTVTDADLVLGYLDPGYFLGGNLSLDVDGARAALSSTIAEPLGIDVVEAAWGVHAIVNENMASASRVTVVERGMDPSQLPLFSFGGAGPVHACRVAMALGSPIVIIPAGAGVMSAAGFLDAPLAFDFVRTRRGGLSETDWAEVNGLFSAMEAEGVALLAAAGVAASDVVFTRSADARYVGQGYEIRVGVPNGVLSGAAAVAKSFGLAYAALYGRLGPDVPIEITVWRLVASKPRPRLAMSPPPSPHARAAARRDAWFPETGWAETTVYSRYSLVAGDRFTGPAVVEERESTLVVPPGAAVSVLDDLSLEVRFG